MYKQNVAMPHVESTAHTCHPRTTPYQLPTTIIQPTIYHALNIPTPPTAYLPPPCRRPYTPPRSHPSIPLPPSVTAPARQIHFSPSPRTHPPPRQSLSNPLPTYLPETWRLRWWCRRRRLSAACMITYTHTYIHTLTYTCKHALATCTLHYMLTTYIHT